MERRFISSDFKIFFFNLKEGVLIAGTLFIYTQVSSDTIRDYLLTFAAVQADLDLNLAHIVCTPLMKRPV